MPRPAQKARFGILSRGEVSEWLMVPLSKSGVRKHRGFESRPLRHKRPPRGRPMRALPPVLLAHAPSGALAPVLGRRLRLGRPRGGLMSLLGSSASPSRRLAVSPRLCRLPSSRPRRPYPGVHLRVLVRRDPRPVTLPPRERSPSGLWRRTGNAVWGNPSRVRIPPSPPHPPPAMTLGACVVACGPRP